MVASLIMVGHLAPGCKGGVDIAVAVQRRRVAVPALFGLPHLASLCSGGALPGCRRNIGLVCEVVDVWTYWYGLGCQSASKCF